MSKNLMDIDVALGVRGEALAKEIEQAMHPFRARRKLDVIRHNGTFAVFEVECARALEAMSMIEALSPGSVQNFPRTLHQMLKLIVEMVEDVPVERIALVFTTQNKISMGLFSSQAHRESLLELAQMCSAATANALSMTLTQRAAQPARARAN